MIDGGVSSQTSLGFLRQIPLFSELSAEQLMAISEIAQEAVYADGEVIFEQGTLGQHLYVLVSGEATVRTGGLELATLRAGECFGELALLDNSTRSATVEAGKDVACIKLARMDFQDLLDVSPDLSRSVMRVISQRVRDCLQDA